MYIYLGCAVYRYWINTSVYYISKRYDIIILLNSVFHTLLFQSAPVGGSAFQIFALNVKTEHNGLNGLNSYQRTQIE